MLPNIADFFRDKKILILGFGREGQSTCRFLRGLLPNIRLTVADRREICIDDRNVSLVSGEGYLDGLGDFDVVVKSPGISFRDVEIPEKTLVTCQTDLFLKYAPCRTLGVTGTKGKTTTSTLICSMLRAAGRDARLMGNIGVPVLNELETVSADTVAVIELSSHQLEFTRHSPEAAVFLDLYEEHLEHYRGGFSGYANAKLNIARYQKEGDILIYNALQWPEKYLKLSELPSEKIAVKKDAELPFRLENPHLSGEHNRQDVAFAYAAARLFGVTTEQAERTVREFKGIEHRMEKVGTFCGITFYNDSIATVPRAVECAVDALKNVDTLIFGGMDRGLDYTEFESYLKKSEITNLIGLPDTGHKLCAGLGELAGRRIYKAADMKDAVRFAYAHTAKGKLCLLSPAASSYNAYRDFEEKGRHYKKLVRGLAGVGIT